jgi:hypothetical protein
LCKTHKHNFQQQILNENNANKSNLRFFNANGEHILDLFLSTKDLNICIYDNSAAMRCAKIFWKDEHIQNTNTGLSFEQGGMFESLSKASSQHNLFCFVKVFSGLND